MDEHDLRLAGIRSPEQQMNVSRPTFNSTKTIVKPAWLSQATTPDLPVSTSAPEIDQDPPNIIAPSRLEPRSDTSPTPGRTGEAASKKVKKRKVPSASTPRELRLRSRTMSQSDGKNADDVVMIEQPPGNALSAIAEIKAYMQGEFGRLNNDIKSGQVEIKADIRTAINKVTEQVSDNTRSIAALRGEIDAKVAETVSREINKLAPPAGARCTSLQQDPPNLEAENSYWRCRRSVRCWPVGGPVGELWGNTCDFFTNVLGIPTSCLPESSVETIRKISNPRSNRPSKITDEVLVVFRDVATRDMVFSYAPNLANYRTRSNPPGIRLDFPDFLRGTFSTLERYGILMKSELGGNFRRSIKFDDSAMSLRIDVCFPGDKKWTRIPLEIAAEEVDKKRKLENVATRKRLGSISTAPPRADNNNSISLPGPSGAGRPVPPAVQLEESRALALHSRSGPPARWGNPHM